MNKKMEAAPRQQSQPPKTSALSQSTVSSLPNLPADVKAVRDLRLVRHIPVPDIVEVVASIYPRFDRYLLSKVEHGEEYGIRLRADAQRHLLSHFHESSPEDENTSRRPNRKKPMRVTCRLSSEAYGQLQRELGRTGTTMQSFLENLIIKALNGGEDHGQNH